MPGFAFKLIAGVVIQLTIFGALLFLPAGTLHWWRAWLFIGVMVTMVIWSSLTLPQDLLDERWRPPIQKGQPLADKIVVVLFIASFLALIAFIPLDVFRIHLLGEPGYVASFSSLILIGAGCCVTYLSIRENVFAAPVVKHQEERRHRVIDTGVYRVVRHPMYAGGILLFVGIPLWLESYGGVLLATAPVATIVARIVIEERFLRRELKGYDLYMESVRYRLIPFFW